MVNPIFSAICNAQTWAFYLVDFALWSEELYAKKMAYTAFYKTSWCSVRVLTFVSVTTFLAYDTWKIIPVPLLPPAFDYDWTIGNK